MALNFANLLALVGVGTSIAGTLTSTYGAFKQSKADQQAARWNAHVADNNATLAEWEAQDALDRGEDAAQRHQLKVAGLKGTQRARIAANGIALSEGSPLRILTDTDFLGELDAQVIRANAGREAYSATTKAQQYRDDSAMLNYQADSNSPLLAGATTLLTGATSVASKWYAYRTGASGYDVGQTS